MRRTRTLTTLCLLFCSQGCEGEGDGGKESADASDVPPPPPPPGLGKWSMSTIEQGDVGLGASLAQSSDGKLAVAYFATQGASDGEQCTDVEQSPEAARWSLRYASADGEAWEVEEVATPTLVGLPTGIELRFGVDGVPLIAARTGEPLTLTVGAIYCGAHDVGLYRRDGPGDWSLETVVTTSGQAATGEAGSDFGDIVGAWPALALTSAGDLAIAYKDIHAGGIQRDDFARADLELAWKSGGGGWRYLPVDYGEGAGDYTSLAFDGEGRPVMVYYNPVEKQGQNRHGVWVARSAEDGLSFDQVRLFEGSTAERPALLIRDDGEILIAYYHGGEGRPYLARLAGNASFSDRAAWTTEALGDGRYDEGYYPSLAVDPVGRLGVAYYRCGKVADGIGDCDTDEDAAIFAYQGRGGGDWTYEIIESGTSGLCGTYVDLQFTADGSAVAIWQCSRRSADGFELGVETARREPL